MTDIPLNARVECNDGACGKSTGVIVNPVKRQVTHFVVRDTSLPGASDRLVPVEKVADTSAGTIRLACTRREVAGMDPFTTTRFVKQEVPDVYNTYFGESYAYSEPLVALDTETVPVTEEQIPAKELAIYRGMAVRAGKPKVGQVDELVVDPDSGNITHLLMREGHLWGKKDVALPVSAIEFVDEDTVYLKIDREAVKALPAVPVKRHAG
jgi:sporulation protein YlmC with PRC-barrel domain